jgi:hypothetical protein
LRSGNPNESNSGVRTSKTRKPEDSYVHRMDGEFICDEMAIHIHGLRELICHSQVHTKMAFLSSADDVFCDLLETIERGWTAIEEIARGLER